MCAGLAQSLFRHWITKAKCCRFGGTEAIVLLTFPNQMFQFLLGTCVAQLDGKVFGFLAAPAVEAIIAAIGIVWGGKISGASSSRESARSFSANE
jgi:hypothetical protein